MTTKTMIVLPVIFTEDEATVLADLKGKMDAVRAQSGLLPYRSENEFLVSFTRPFLYDHIAANVELELQEAGYFANTGEFPKFI